MVNFCIGGSGIQMELFVGGVFDPKPTMVQCHSLPVVTKGTAVTVAGKCIYVGGHEPILEIN